MNETPIRQYAFLDGLRGLAAIQVVLLHYLSSFLPTLASAGGPVHFAWETRLSTRPLAYLWDGYSAVYLFFAMSGFVLAGSFIKSDLSIAQQVLKRFLRLWLPVVAASLVAFLLGWAIFPTKAAALGIGHSGWLSGVYHNPMTLPSVARDLFVNSMLAGYQGVSLLPQLFGDWANVLTTPGTFSLNPPMWTLHGEFWGSLLVLALAIAYRNTSRQTFALIVCLILVYTGTSQLSLFVAGFLLFLVRDRLLSRKGLGVAVVSLALIVFGIMICVRRNVPPVLRMDVFLVARTHLSAYNDGHFESSLGALLVLIGVLLNPTLRRWLSNRVVDRLGRLSFSIYLLHFPIMLSVGCAVFAHMQRVGYLCAVLISILVGLATTIAAAAVFERYIDRNAILAASRAAHSLHLSLRRGVGIR